MFDEADEIADDDALELITRLQKRTAEVGAEIGLHQVHFSISPGPPRMAQIVFGLTPEAVETIEQVEAKQIDKEFESLMSGLDLGDEVSEPAASAVGGEVDAEGDDEGEDDEGGEQD